MAAEFTVVCGTCKQDAQLVADADGEVAVCPECGQRDTLENANRIASEHFLQQAIGSLPGRSASDLFVQFQSKRGAQQTFKWHAVPV
jgi:uncharacterized Zn finger protein (UPF0148 family)